MTVAADCIRNDQHSEGCSTCRWATRMRFFGRVMIFKGVGGMLRRAKLVHGEAASAPGPGVGCRNVWGRFSQRNIFTSTCTVSSQHPLPDGEDFDGGGNGGEGQAGFLGEEELAGLRVFGGGVLERPGFALEGGGIVHGGADLNQVFRAVGMAGEEIDFVAFGGFDVGDFRTPALEFDKNGGFERVSVVGFSAAVEDGNEGGIGGVNLARVDLAAFFGVGGDRDCLEELYGKAKNGMTSSTPPITDRALQPRRWRFRPARRRP